MAVFCKAYPSITALTETLLYQGYPVLTGQTNWNTALDTTWNRSLEEVDFAIGRQTAFDLSGVVTVERDHNWTLGDRAQVDTFRQWTAARAGCLAPFWLPSLQNDVQLITAVSPGATYLIVRNDGQTLLDGTGRRDLLLQPVPGVYYFSRIMNAVLLESGDIRLNLDTPLPGPVGRDALVAYMRLCRLATDTVELAYHTESVATAQLPLVSVRES